MKVPVSETPEPFRLTQSGPPATVEVWSRDSVVLYDADDRPVVLRRRVGF